MCVRYMSPQIPPKVEGSLSRVQWLLSLEWVVKNGGGVAGGSAPSISQEGGRMLCLPRRGLSGAALSLTTAMFVITLTRCCLELGVLSVTILVLSAVTKYPMKAISGGKEGRRQGQSEGAVCHG